MESILILSMVIIGGAGSIWGPVVGAVGMVVLPEALRFVGLPSAVAANVRQSSTVVSKADRSKSCSARLARSKNTACM